MDYILDTHILVWRFGDASRLSKKAKNLFKDIHNRFLVPCISLLEMQFLQEIGRIEGDLDEVAQTINREEQFCLLPFDENTLFQAIKLTSTRDPFDRMILAHALDTSTPILTKDRWMKKEAPQLVIF